jgi:hypothetical protein
MNSVVLEYLVKFPVGTCGNISWKFIFRAEYNRLNNTVCPTRLSLK